MYCSYLTGFSSEQWECKQRHVLRLNKLFIWLINNQWLPWDDLMLGKRGFKN